MSLRHTSIRLRMFLLVSVPLLALIGVYAYAVAGQWGTAVGLANAGKVSGTTITPVSDALVALNAERSGATSYLAANSSQAMSAYRQDEAATDREFRVVESVTRSGPVTANATPLEKEAAARFINDYKGLLQALRGEVASGSIARTPAINAYSAIMADGLRVGEQGIQVTYVSQSLATTARQEVNLYAAQMLVLEENDIYSGDMAAGAMPAADRAEFAQLAALRQYLVQDAVPQLDAEASGLLRQEVPASLTAALTSQENAIISAPVGGFQAPVPITLWQATAGTYASHLEVMLTKSPAWIQAQVASSARRALTILIVAASVGLLAVIASIVFSLLLGRRLLRRLGGLRESALELAHHRLPAVMARLRDGDTVDVDAETPPAEVSGDEVDQVRQAFNTVHRAAVQAAVEEADLRRGVSSVFRNLARRNQALLHRQLGLLDGMERRAEEPEQLEDLFRVDHLTTRMRRHAEGLIVLSGDSPGRSWSQPVLFIDVLRAAVAEVEDYARIRVEVRSKAALAGPAVADVVHLLAELMENATVFSPPNTMVRVQGELVGRGFAVEIEDRGLGIAPERMEEFNRDLASLPAFDPAGSDRLGLFITGRLAHRHGIKISLRSSIYGGTTAVVIIPTSLVVTASSQISTHEAAGRVLEPAATAAALSSVNGHGANAGSDNGQPYHGQAYHGQPENGHLDYWQPEHGLPEHRPAGDGLGATADYRRPRHAAPVVMAAATELVPGSNGQTRRTDQHDGELPVRVRQESLAPQLRNRETTDSGAFPAPPGSAEALRSRMSTMQRGWERGRSAAAGPPGEAGPAAVPAEPNRAAQGGE